MVPKYKHSIGDIVCWSEYYDIVGVISSIRWYDMTGAIYIVEWCLENIEKIPNGIFPHTSHTDMGISNMKMYLQQRINLANSCNAAKDKK